MRRELDGLAEGVHNPAKDELASGPATVALEQLLEGDSFIPVRFIKLRPGEDLVDSVEEVVT